MTNKQEEEKYFIECPLCKVKIEHSSICQNKVKTHYWKCTECPFIGFEYWSPMDVNNLKVAAK